MNNELNPQQWLDEHGDYLFRYAMAQVRNEEIAADLLQDTLLAAWKARDSFASQSSLRTWLTGILKHKVIDHIRGNIRRRQLDEKAVSDPTISWFNNDGSWADAPQAWQANPESLLTSDDFRLVLDRCIAALPVQQQSVFRLRELLGEDSQNICKQCDITTTHLHVLLHRARMALRRCLQGNWFGQEHSS